MAITKSDMKWARGERIILCFANNDFDKASKNRLGWYTYLEERGIWIAGKAKLKKKSSPTKYEWFMNINFEDSSIREFVSRAGAENYAEYVAEGALATMQGTENKYINTYF